MKHFKFISYNYYFFFECLLVKVGVLFLYYLE